MRLSNMSWYDIKQQVDNLATSWESFKSNNEKRLQHIETNQNTDVIIEEQVKTLNTELDKCREKINNLILQEKRPGMLNSSNKTNLQYKQFADYLRHGNTIANSINTKAATKCPVAHETIPADLYEEITARTMFLSPIRRLSSKLRLSDSERFDYLLAPNAYGATWCDDTNAPSNAQEKICKGTIAVQTLYSQPYISSKIINDIDFDAIEWLIGSISYDFAKAENAAFVKGDGQNQPQGIISNSADIAKTYTTTEKNLVAEDIIKYFTSIDPEYLDEKNTAFLMSPGFIAKARLLKDNTGRYIWMPEAGEADSIMGIKLYPNTALGKGEEETVEAIYGNFRRGYQIVDRTNIEILRDPFTQQPFIKFYITKRLGAGVINKSAFNLLLSSAKP